MKKIAIKGASWDSMFLTFSKVLSMLFNILSAKMLSMGLSLEVRGTYAQANVVLSTGASIILLGLVDSMNYYFNSKDKSLSEELKARIVNTVFFLEISFGSVLAIFILFGRGLIADYFSNPAVSNLLFIVAVLPVFQNVINFMQVLCVSVGRAKWMSIYTLVVTIMRILAVYLSVYVLHNIIWIYVFILLMDVINLCLYNHDIRKKGIKVNPFKITTKYIKPILSFGLPMGVYAATSSFTRELGKLVIGKFGGTEELAIYDNCSKLLPVDIFVTSFALVLVPYIYRRVSEGRREESVDLFSSYLKVGYYTVWTLGTMVLVAPSAAISFLYADAYTVGVGVFVLFVFDSMLRFASVHLILTAAGKAKNVMLYSIIALVLNLVLNVLFYYFWGMIGPAIATLVVAFVYMFLILSDTKHTINARWTEIFDFKDVLWFLFTLAAVWFVAFTLNRLLVNLGVHIYIAMILCMAIFGLSILALHRKKIFGILKKINSFKL